MTPSLPGTRPAMRPLIDVLKTLETGTRPAGGVRDIASGVPSLGGEHLNDTGGFKLDHVRFIPVDFAARLGTGRIHAGDVLVVKDGATTGKVSVVRDNFPFETAFVNEHIFLCRPSRHVDPEYLFYFLFSDRGKSQILSDFRGAAQGGITRAFAAKVSIPIIPVGEQRSVVAFIEQQLTRSYAADANLGIAGERLRAYAAGLLEAAYSGGKRGQLPRGWRWAQLRQLVAGGPQNGVYIPKSEYGSGTPILRIDDFQDWSSRSAFDMKKVKADREVLDRYSLRSGDLVINRVNSPSHLGKCLVVEERHLPSLFESNMMRLRLVTSVSPRYVELYLRSPSGRRRLTAGAKWAVNQASINQQDVLKTHVPLPPSLEAQQQIVSTLDAKLGATAHMADTVKSAVSRSKGLRRRVLADVFAFNGITPVRRR